MASGGRSLTLGPGSKISTHLRGDMLPRLLLLVYAVSARSLPSPPTRASLALRGGGSAEHDAYVQRTEARLKTQVEIDGHSSGSTIAECVFNLVNNVAGAGLLTLSAGMAMGVGYGPAVGVALALGAVSAATFSMIGWSCDRLNASTFGELWAATLGKGTAWVIDAFIAAMCASACVVYSGIIGDVGRPLLHLAGANPAWNTRAAHIVGSAVGVLLPLCLAKSLAFLAYTSLLGLGAVLYTALFVAIRYFDGSYAPGGALRAQLVAAGGAAPAFAHASAWGLSPKAFVLLSNFGLAYIAHYNAPKFYSDLERRSPQRFDRVVLVAFSVLALLYTGVMVLGHLTFGDVTRSNLLLNYAEGDALAVLGRVATALSILFGYPLAFVGLRDSVGGLCRHWPQTLGWAAAPAARGPLTVGLVAAATTAAVLLTDIGLVVGLTGAVMGSAIVYVVPACIFLRAAELSGAKLPRATKAAATALVPLGAFLGVLGVYFTLKEFSA